jgi:hypothetical protein
VCHSSDRRASGVRWRATCHRNDMTSDMAFSIGLFAGWLALVVWLVWPDPHCACCAKRATERVRDRL